MPRVLEAPVCVAKRPVRLGPGESIGFEVVLDGVREDAFAVSWKGGLVAYVNRCRHLGLPLDFGDGRFFDDEFDALVCCNHGARYRPEDGLCVEGPCEGARLTRLVLEERDGAVWCTGVG